MKKKILSFLSVLMCLSVTLCGCDGKNEVNSGNNESVYDPFEEIVSEEMYTYPDYTVTWEYDNIAHLSYNGDSVSVTLKIDNKKRQTSLGFVTFVDGYCVPSTIDKKTGMMNIVTFAKDESKDIKISFSPTSGEKGDILSARIMTVIEPEYLPSFTNGDSSFGHFHDIGSTALAEIKLNATPKSVRRNCKSAVTDDITDEIRNKYHVDEKAFSKEQYEKFIKNQELPISERDPDATYMTNSFWCCYYNEINVSHINYTASDKSRVTLNLSALASTSADYRVTVFANNKPITSIDGYECAEFKTRLEGYSHTELTYDFSKYGEKVLIYAVVVPVTKVNNDTYWDDEQKTPSFVLLF